MNNDFLVSVIITTYKRDVSIVSKAVKSILNQTYKKIEVIIVDDSPSDYVNRPLIKEYCETIGDKRVKYIQHKINMGACVARNTGIQNANGEFVCFLDDDDQYMPNKIEKMIDYFKEEDVVLVYCDIAMYQNEKYRKKYSEIQEPKKGYVYDEIMKVNFIGPTSISLIRMKSLKEVGCFDPEMEASQDWDLWIRLSKIGKVQYVNEVLFNYYSDAGASVDRISNNTQRRIRALNHLNEKNMKYLKMHKDAFASRKEYEMRMLISDKKILKSIKCYFEVVKNRPKSVLKNIILLKAFGRIIFNKSV